MGLYKYAVEEWLKSKRYEELEFLLTKSFLHSLELYF